MNRQALFTQRAYSLTHQDCGGLCREYYLSLSEGRAGEGLVLFIGTEVPWFLSKTDPNLEKFRESEMRRERERVVYTVR